MHCLKVFVRITSIFSLFNVYMCNLDSVRFSEEKQLIKSGNKDKLLKIENHFMISCKDGIKFLVESCYFNI